MDYLTDFSAIEQLLTAIQAWLGENVLVYGNFIQLCLIVLIFLLTRYFTPKAKSWQQDWFETRRSTIISGTFQNIVTPLVFPIIWLLTLSLLLLIAAAADLPYHLIKIAVSLLAAWVIIRLTAGFVKNRIWAKMIAVIAWTVAALNILNLLEPTTEVLDGIAINLGALRISALTVINGLLTLIILLWLAAIVSRLIEQQIKASSDLTPSVKVLISKLIKFTLIIVAVVAAIASVGIDLTVFTVFSGAIGVGIGFGLQKSIANLFSGLVLLMDKSIKPGDVIAIGDTYGWVNTLGARYVSIYTRDGIEHLIPNEQLITQEVQSWSHTNRLIRLRIPIGVHYESDVRKAIELCIESASEVDRILEDPPSVCLLTGFGDSSVDLELRVWINDPQAGTSNVKSEILLKVWDKFHDHKIEIPYPQRDIHIRSSIMNSEL
ncbi:MAG: mechanosensitive ion channel domain-containing protein [Gammaproteobacteria bacterium]